MNISNISNVVSANRKNDSKSNTDEVEESGDEFSKNLEDVDGQEVVHARAENSVENIVNATKGRLLQKKAADEKFDRESLAAASLNTGSKIAGPRPWDGEWIKEGLQMEASDSQKSPVIKLSDALKEQIKSLEKGSELSMMEPGAKLGKVLQKNPQLDPSVVAAAQVAGQKTNQRQLNVQSQQAQKMTANMGNQVSPMEGELSTQMYFTPVGTAQLSSQANRAALRDFQERSPDRRLTSLKGNRDLSAVDFLSARKKVNEPKMLPASKAPVQATERSIESLQDGLANTLNISRGQAGDRFSLVRPESMAMSPALSSRQQSELPKIEVKGHVTSGAMAQSRISSQGLMSISQGLGELASQGGGTMRIRLQPDHLGEVTLQVQTLGNRVDLRIQAADGSAKQILEESISHLRDKMAAQQLKLNSVDLVLSSAGSSQSGLSSGLGQGLAMASYVGPDARVDVGASSNGQDLGSIFGDQANGQSGRNGQNQLSGDEQESGASVGMKRSNGHVPQLQSGLHNHVSKGRIDVRA